MSGRFRNNDPDTSREAAMKLDATRLQQIVLNTLGQFPSGLTAHEVADITGIALVTISPRMKPLEEKGAVERVGKRVPQGYTRKQTVWCIRKEAA
jgi:Fic family protein